MSNEKVGGGVLTPVQAIVWGTAVAGALDYIFASTRTQMRGVPWYEVWKFVAGAILGPETASSGGWATVLFGSLLHFTVAACIVSVYVIASRFIPFLVRRFVLCGLGYGAVAYFVMNLVAIPLTRLSPRPFRLDVPDFLVHVFAIGLTAAYFARRASVSS